jgi:hypothetical protein
MLVVHPLLRVVTAKHIHMGMEMPGYLAAGIVVAPALGLCVAGAMATLRSV